MFANRINTTTALSCPDTQWFQLLDLHDLLKYNFAATKYCTFSAVETMIRKFVDTSLDSYSYHDQIHTIRQYLSSKYQCASFTKSAFICPASFH